MFSQTSEYALRAVVWLAEHRNEGPVGNKRIAADTQVPASYLSKILHDLASAGFLSSRRGVGGGFQLIVPPDELSMLDVVNAVDPLKRITFCAHVAGESQAPMCPMHQRLNRAIGLVQKTLAESSIQDVMHAEPSAGDQPQTPDGSSHHGHAMPSAMTDGSTNHPNSNPMPNVALPSVMATSGAR